MNNITQHSSIGRNKNRRFLIAAMVLLLAGSLLVALGGCAPKNNAVGDSPKSSEDAPHDSVQGQRMTVGVVGSPHATADQLVMDAYKRDGIDAIYTQVKDAKEPQRVAQEAVEDYVHRRVLAILICDLDAKQDPEGWNQALNKAQEAGIPVILLTPVNPPEDSKLYAATFMINDRMRDAEPIATATKTIIRDEPHERDIMVSTLPSE